MTLRPRNEYPTLNELTEAQPVAILRDGVVQAVVPTPNQAFDWIFRTVPYSVSHALQYEGWSCRYATEQEWAR